MAGKRLAGMGYAVWILAAGLAVWGAQGLLEAAEGESKVVAARKKVMQGNNKAFKAIQEAAKADKYGIILVQGSEIAENAMEIPDAFEKKDLSGKTRALPKIWEEKDKFKQIASKLMADARALEEAAQNKDKEKVTAAFKALGATCDACHKDYRAERKE